MRLAPFFLQIRENLGKLLKVGEDKINIKAGTAEGLGWLGRKRGMAAMAAVLLEKRG